MILGTKNVCKLTPKKSLLIFFIFLVGSAYSQSTNWNQIIYKVYAHLQKAKDYKVDANIKVDLPFIRILPINAKIYVKQPNKFKVESKSIAIVPRQGFDRLNEILSDTNQFTAIAQATELVDKVNTQIISLVPLQDTGDLILAKLWIDIKRSLVLKSSLTTKLNGTILTEYTYGSFSNYGLPDAMTFTVDIKKFKIPKTIAADINSNAKKQGDQERQNKKGKIIITLSNYLINKGIQDAVFAK